jgi:hypothetical protein
VTRTELTAAGAPSYTRSVGAWPPAWRVATRSPLDYQGLAAIVRSALEDRDRAIGVKPLREGDRAVWRAAMTLPGGPLEIVVDQATGIVLWCADQKATFTATVDWKAPPRAGTTYRLDVPAGRKVVTKRETDYTYASSLAAAGRTAGYAPLESTLAPDGYALKAVATGSANGGLWTQAGTPAGTHKSASLRVPPEKRIDALYTRGLNWCAVEQLGPKGSAGDLAGLTAAFLARSPQSLLSLQADVLQYGAMTGATAYTWFAESGPTLFVAGKGHLVYATGSMTRQELLSFAEGLRPVGAGS